MTPADVDAALRRGLRPVDREWQRTALRRAAVLAPIVSVDGRDAVLFVVRAASLRQHAGQIGFPGGADEGDDDPVTCALREAEEEVGIRPAEVALLGSVAPRQSSSGYRVHCVVGRVADAAGLRADDGEIDRLLPVPLTALLPADRWYEHSPPAPPGRPPYPPSPHFRHGTDLIWGLTGRFCADLLAALRPPPPRP
ncbi:MAG: CoA pyrophosphatase [Planctomycetota bacterium]